MKSLVSTAMTATATQPKILKISQPKRREPDMIKDQIEEAIDICYMNFT